MANRGRGLGTKHVGSVKPHKEDFDSHFADLASFYEPTSTSKRRKMSGSNQTRVLKSPHKIGIPTRSRIRHSPRKHKMPAIPLEKDVLKKKVTPEKARKTIDVTAEVEGKDKDVEGNLTMLVEEEDDDFNDNLIIPPPSNSHTQDQTVIVVRDSQDMGCEGETSILRSQLSDQLRKFEVVVQKKKDCEVHLKDKMLEEKKKQERTLKRIETRRMFLKQDLQVLGQKLREKENESRKRESPTFIEESESEEEGPENTSENANENVSENTAAGRRCVLKVRDKTRLAVERMSLMSEGPRWCDEKTRLMMLTPTINPRDVLSTSLATLRRAVSQALPSVGEELSEMLRLSVTDNLHHLMSGAEILLITQTCAQVLQTIKQSGDSSSLATVLSLLQLAWRPKLELSEELCSAVITSIYDLVSLGDVSSVINPQLVSQVFRLLSVVSRHPRHCAALCKGGGEDRLGDKTSSGGAREENK